MSTGQLAALAAEIVALLGALGGGLRWLLTALGQRDEAYRLEITRLYDELLKAANQRTEDERTRTVETREEVVYYRELALRGTGLLEAVARKRGGT